MLSSFQANNFGFNWYGAVYLILIVFFNYSIVIIKSFNVLVFLCFYFERVREKKLFIIISLINLSIYLRFTITVTTATVIF